MILIFFVSKKGNFLVELRKLQKGYCIEKLQKVKNVQLFFIYWTLFLIKQKLKKSKNIWLKNTLVI